MTYLDKNLELIKALDKFTTKEIAKDITGAIPSLAEIRQLVYSETNYHLQSMISTSLASIADSLEVIAEAVKKASLEEEIQPKQ